ncbi:RNA polymerase sigma factor [Muriicola sp. Z0-33]|uniref:RNA polymerase sigma factor n=1 Tax=Muriicola sp. Z0-33 TaxID=2816957 RepID=UPI0022376CB7|nr:RNA polymerase sigma factor [Muriicola sp. Z0-33]MCW5516449.1 RNA polymerase sigma factor [Muriicola sp. Z0-33]
MGSETDNYNNLKSFFNDEYHSLKAYANSRISDTADRNAEDIVQEVALKIFARSEDLTPINNIAGFVYNAIRNKIIDLMRTKKGISHVEDEMENRLLEFTELFYGKSDNAYSDTMKMELKKAIFNLKPLYRDIIIAIDFEGYTYKEVSLETSVPEGTLMSRRHRALSILLKELEEIKETIN